MKVAVVGCTHGELDMIYDQLDESIDILLLCGDFQAVRNEEDLNSLACPPKYRQMHDFHQYYSGKKTAGILTIVIGGNHESANHFCELPYGGWLAPNIYFLGYAGCVRYGPLRINGVSGIFKKYNFHKSRSEFPTFNEEQKRSFYHYKRLDLFRLEHLPIRHDIIDIILSHDWPSNMWKYGNYEQLFRHRSDFEDQAHRNELGCPALGNLLISRKPDYWFSAHLHVFYQAQIDHITNEKKQRKTIFMAHDKTIKRRHYLSIIDIDDTTSNHNITTTSDEMKKKKVSYDLSYDLDWLCILKQTEKFQGYLSDRIQIPNQLEKIDKKLKEDLERQFKNNFVIPLNFYQTVPVFPMSNVNFKYSYQINEQTKQLCDLLKINDITSQIGRRLGVSHIPIAINPNRAQTQTNENEIELDDDDST
ncbi:hypothetical protein SNEBB_010095 [Seison nebaliae]|nr:hypothetical protein SNEBB_010095 [Seison nebaliae]